MILCWQENILTWTPHSLFHSALNLYYSLRQMFYELMRSQICSKSISINALLTFSYLLLFMRHALIFRAILLIIYDVQIISQYLRIQKSSWSQFRMSYRKNMSSRFQLSHKIYSVPQSILHQSKQTTFNLGEKSSLISLPQKESPSTMTFPKNMTY